jgi:hypothetical protein
MEQRTHQDDETTEAGIDDVGGRNFKLDGMNIMRKPGTWQNKTHGVEIHDVVGRQG